MNRSSGAASRQLIGIAIGADVVRGEDRRQELDAVVRQQPDDVAGTDSSRVEPGRQRGRPIRHRPIGDGVVAVDRERPVRRTARVVLEHSDPAHVGMDRRHVLHGTHYGAA